MKKDFAVINHKPRGIKSIAFEEAMLRTSDSRFVLRWILPHRSLFHTAINYGELEGGAFSRREKLWRLELRDTLNRQEITIRTRALVNCTGVSVDKLNERFGIETPYRHVFSKGVYLGFIRPPEHRAPLIFEMGKEGDVLTWVPWGPISLWGPTETLVGDAADGFSPSREDVQILLESAHKRLGKIAEKSNIVSLRSGVRPLPVKRNDLAERYPLSISRRHLVFKDPQIPWISVYGGKLTDSQILAEKLIPLIRRVVPSTGVRAEQACPEGMDMTTFPGLQEKFPTLEWCIENELCCTLEDYLRRRTNIAQWVPREGLGKNDENLPHLETLIRKICGNDPSMAKDLLRQYQDRVHARFDQVLTPL